MLELNKMHHGDCIELMKQMPDNSVDAIVTDPPYGLEFMGKEWDKLGAANEPTGGNKDTDPFSMQRGQSIPFGGGGNRIRYGSSAKSAQLFHQRWAKEALRVLKPGGHALVFGGTRTHHRLMCGLEDAGFEIRDTIMWVYGSGFPKSLNIGKAVDKLQGNEREVVKVRTDGHKASNGVYDDDNYVWDKPFIDTKGTSEWEGWGTALKPSFEPIVMARKPLNEKTVTMNVLKWGTGGINIDGCRVEYVSEEDKVSSSSSSAFNSFSNNPKAVDDALFKVGAEFHRDINMKGRFPANFIHDGSHEVVRMFPKEAGGGNVSVKIGRSPNMGRNQIYGKSGIVDGVLYTDSGSASRFFYCAKAGREDRDFGLIGTKNTHPTVKPLLLMRYLCRMVTPPNGIVLDPFAGTGSTCIAARQEGFRFIGMEKEQQYCEIANRIVEVLKQKNLREVEK